MTASIALSGVAVDRGGRRILEDVSVQLDQRRIAVVGANGSGKSTFARLLNGLVTASSGSISVHGLDPAREGRALRRRVGFVFSNPDAQIIMPTVAEDVAFSLRGRGLDHRSSEDRVAAALDAVGLTALAEQSAHSLSGGQKQLLALAAILVTEPDLIIADEPTALLDMANARRIVDHLFDATLRQLVLVTHDLRLAARCDIALRFDGGRLVDAGSPEKIIADYERTAA
ncbi:energy-coupling factor ABC transporter ATP-binding protein [Microbacterium rhizomatis]|uniref:ABC transporter ATP-binding protein n=1 Tax=Microbacterium rhizomatis TaxID=1631477 RepID=A0A5J5IZW7_9MICO|nr:ABC transporter ATP-binding protein [Microbacterium rhizomatis]KAA9105088.1 ABC transporter ATP-binding protein [Microbacterium rhizomatis]